VLHHFMIMIMDALRPSMTRMVRIRSARALAGADPCGYLGGELLIGIMVRLNSAVRHVQVAVAAVQIRALNLGLAAVHRVLRRLIRGVPPEEIAVLSVQLVVTLTHAAKSLHAGDPLVGLASLHEVTARGMLLLLRVSRVRVRHLLVGVGQVMITRRPLARCFLSTCLDVVVLIIRLRLALLRAELAPRIATSVH